MTGAQASLLPDGRRLHLHHGPIDLIVEAQGPECEVQAAYRQAVRRFQPLLQELVEELPLLRRPLDAEGPLPAGKVARRMVEAGRRHLPNFVTAMAAVAGAVADEVLATMVTGRRLRKAYVNNGGDTAIHLTDGEEIVAAMGGSDGRVKLDHGQRARGLATSGWRGRSHSLGIADSVTVLAQDATTADVAATLIANAVDLPGHPAIRRKPASVLNDDSDLGGRLVTTDVGSLSKGEVLRALEGGLARADAFKKAGLIEDAALFLAGESALLAGGAKGPFLSCRPAEAAIT